MSDLIDAVCCGDRPKVEAILRNNPDLDAKGEGGLTALHHAAMLDNAEMVNLLLDAGSDTHARDGADGWTAIFLAAEHGSGEAIKALAKHGVDPNEPGKGGNRPLHIAAAGLKTAALVVLLELGADVNAQREDGCVALHVSAVNSNAEKVSLLINAGADLGICNNAGLTPHRLFLAEGNILGEDLDGLFRANYH